MRQRALVATAVLWSVLALVPALQAQGTGDRFGLWDVHVNEDPVTGEDLRIAAAYQTDADLFFSFVCRNEEASAIVRPFDHDKALPPVGESVTVYWKVTTDPDVEPIKEQWTVTEQGVTADEDQASIMALYISTGDTFLIGIPDSEGNGLVNAYLVTPEHTLKMIDMMECL